MKIAIDLDEVTVALLDGLTSYHNTYYQTSLTLQDYEVFALHETWGCTPREAMKRVYEFYASPHMDNLKPIKGALEGIRKLYKNHSLVFITSRPTFTNVKTEKWIQNCFPNIAMPVYYTNQFSPNGEKKQKKSQICKNLDVSLIIEDSPGNISDCVSENISVLIYSWPWNTNIRENNLITRVYDWNDVLRKVKKISS